MAAEASGESSGVPSSTVAVPTKPIAARPTDVCVTIDNFFISLFLILTARSCRAMSLIADR